MRKRSIHLRPRDAHACFRRQSPILVLAEGGEEEEPGNARFGLFDTFPKDVRNRSQHVETLDRERKDAVSGLLGRTEGGPRFRLGSIPFSRFPRRRLVFRHRQCAVLSSSVCEVRVAHPLHRRGAVLTPLPVHARARRASALDRARPLDWKSHDALFDVSFCLFGQGGAGVFRDDFDDFADRLDHVVLDLRQVR